jgi:hypothetical protein
VRLTVSGSDVATRWKSLQGSAEERWRAEIGINRTDRLRTSLEQLVAVLPLEHPTTRPVMGRRTQASRAETDRIGNQCPAVMEVLFRTIGAGFPSLGCIRDELREKVARCTLTQRNGD